MSLSAFPYIGGKTNIWRWVVDALPKHTTYVEPFGGSGAVLLNKPRSTVEVYNDVDRDVVQFFEVAKNRPDELREWCARTPFAEELHQRYVEAFYDGYRPDDPIERAGRFLFLRYSQFGAKYARPSGFKRDTARARQGESSSWASVGEKIAETCERLQGVSIQNGDYRDVLDHYDDPETVFYLDPPYYGSEHLYRTDGFDHHELATALRGRDARVLVSYADPPGDLYADWSELRRDAFHNAGVRGDEDGTGRNEVTERLFSNFNPAKSPAFVDANLTQKKLGEVTG